MRVEARQTRSFDAEVLCKRTCRWVAGKAVLLDRRPRASITAFTHHLSCHAIVLHVAGANTFASLRLGSGATVTTGSTIGQVTLIPAGLELEGRSDFPERIRHVLLLLDPDALGAAMGTEVSSDRMDLAYRPHLADPAIASQMRALQAELDEPGLLGRLYAESLCCEIAVRLLRKCLKASTAPARGGLASYRLRMVRDYMEENLASEMTLADLAAIAGISHTHFCRAFHASTGVPPHRYIIARRVERAKGLLADGDMRIAEIAIAVGFGDQSHMTKHFRSLVGTTPGRFREEASPPGRPGVTRVPPRCPALSRRDRPAAP